MRTFTRVIATGLLGGVAMAAFAALPATASAESTQHGTEAALDGPVPFPSFSPSPFPAATDGEPVPTPAFADGPGGHPAVVDPPGPNA